MVAVYCLFIFSLILCFVVSPDIVTAVFHAIRRINVPQLASEMAALEAEAAKEARDKSEMLRDRAEGLADRLGGYVKSLDAECSKRVRDVETATADRDYYKTLHKAACTDINRNRNEYTAKTRTLTATAAKHIRRADALTESLVGALADIQVGCDEIVTLRKEIAGLVDKLVHLVGRRDHYYTLHKTATAEITRIDDARGALFEDRKRLLDVVDNHETTIRLQAREIEALRVSPSQAADHVTAVDLDRITDVSALASEMGYTLSQYRQTLTALQHDAGILTPEEGAVAVALVETEAARSRDLTAAVSCLSEALASDARAFMAPKWVNRAAKIVIRSTVIDI